MRYSLNKPWTITSSSGVISKDIAPCSVMSALIRNKIIEDPYYRLNESVIQPYLMDDYTFETSFELSDRDLKRKNYLVFEKLCTIAEIYVNSIKIANVSDMHRRYIFLLDNQLLEKQNQLKIVFKSSKKYIRDYLNEEKLFESYAVTDVNNPVIRQAHYMFGWDWGPYISDMGIMGDSYILSTSSGYLKSFRHHYKFNDDGSVEIKVDLELVDTGNSKIDVILSGHGENIKKTYVNDLIFRIDKPKLWNPQGFGEPNLYDLSIIINGEEKEEYHYQIGIRKIHIDDSKDEYGRNFAIYVNDKKIFLKGSNYIPEDNIIPFVNKERTEKLLTLARDFNHNCIRVWGGGYYPNDDFYETCDKLGLLVFQDLMFACASYNIDDPLFKENIINETIDNLKRIRHHASILLIAGNNEVEDGVRGHGYKQAVQYIEMFHHILKDIVNKETDYYYLPSSPTSGDPYFASPNDTSYLDTHYWWVWGQDRIIEDYLNIKPRLLSEFGLQSFPIYETIYKYANKDDMSLDSDVMLSHQKDPSKTNEKMMRYVRREFNVNEKNIKEVTYLSMLAQAEGIKLCVENLRGNKYRCNGAIYWQLNDCWPCPSLSSIDYYYGLKALHYYSKRFYCPHLVSFKSQGSLRINISNDENKKNDYQLSYSSIDLNFNVSKPSFLSISVEKYSDFDAITLKDCKNLYGYVAYLYNKDGKLLSSNIYRFKKDKECEYRKAEIEIAQINDREFEISASEFVRAIYLNPHDNNVIFSDNFFDLLPSQKIRITSSKAINKDDIEIMCVNNI